MSRLNYVPLVTAVAVGIGDGAVGRVTHAKWAPLIARVAVFGSGLAIDRMGGNPNIGIGMMAASAGLIAQRIPRAIHDKSVSDLSTITGQYAVRAADGNLGPQIPNAGSQMHTPSTIAGYGYGTTSYPASMRPGLEATAAPTSAGWYEPSRTQPATVAG